MEPHVRVQRPFPPLPSQREVISPRPDGSGLLQAAVADHRGWLFGPESLVLQQICVCLFFPASPCVFLFFLSKGFKSATSTVRQWPVRVHVLVEWPRSPFLLVCYETAELVLGVIRSLPFRICWDNLCLRWTAWSGFVMVNPSVLLRYAQTSLHLFMFTQSWMRSAHREIVKRKWGL